MPPKDPPGCLFPEALASHPLALSFSSCQPLIKSFIRRALLIAAVRYFLFSCFQVDSLGRLLIMTPACSQLRAA